MNGAGADELAPKRLELDTGVLLEGILDESARGHAEIDMEAAASGLDRERIERPDGLDEARDGVVARRETTGVDVHDDDVGSDGDAVISREIGLGVRAALRVLPRRVERNFTAQRDQGKIRG